LQFLALKREVEVKDYLLVNVMTHCSTYVAELVVEEEHRLLAGAEEEVVEEISSLQKIVEVKAMVVVVEEQVVRCLAFVNTCLCCSRESLN
jgi:hypothetical protein